jgi:hypothetical protein
LRPLVRGLLPAIESAATARLKGRAVQIGDPEIVRMIDKDAAWPAAAKATIETTAPEAACDLLNAAGIDPRHAPLIALGGALAAIATQHLTIAQKLDEMAAEAIRRRREAASAASAGAAP